MRERIAPRKGELVIAVSGLTKHYGDRVVVDDVTFEVAGGRVTGFVGPNGAGKSTTMRAMIGLTRPDRGDVHYDGVRYENLRHPARIVGSVLDPLCMHPGRTARHHLAALAALSRIPVERVDEVLDDVGLTSAAGRRVGGYSLGMRQRLALAGALLGDPMVLILDEPSNGLDPDGIQWLRTVLRRFADSGGTVFVSSHLIGELERLADDLVVLGNGKVITATSVEHLLADCDRPIVVETPRGDALASLLAAAGFAVDADGSRLIVRGATTAAVSDLAFDHRIRVTAITEAAPSLEDVLVEMTGRAVEFASERPAQTMPVHLTGGHR